MQRKILFAGALSLAVSFLPAVASAAEFTLVIKDHRFHPAQLTVPAGERVKLLIDNRDPTPEEFESHDLRREKIIPGHGKGVVWVGPLSAGKYRFFGEFHESTARGELIAK